MTRFYIGTSGWHYDDWRGRFYPEKLPKTRWLEYYSRHFPTLELNNTFYRLPAERVFGKWRHTTPEGFVFSVKVSRRITHLKRLKDCREEVERFLSRAGLLEEKLGPLLYQLPPGLERDDDLLKAFLSLLPGGVKPVFEFRHPSWFAEEIYDLLRGRGVGFCVFHMPQRTSPILATADFAYFRFHGSHRLYAGCYSDEELADWARKISRCTARVSFAFIYFNNDVAGYALKNAERLTTLLGRA